MIKDKITQSFLIAMGEIEETLSEMAFLKDRFSEKGSAYFVYFKKHNTKVEFLFGPPQFEVEMIIYSEDKKFAFKDLLQIPVIIKWVNDNRYIANNTRNMKAEILWFVDLLKVSLPNIVDR